MKNKYDYSQTENEQKKKKFRLFDMNRDGKGVDEHEDRTPNLKFFFKLYFRKFSKLIQLNLLMIFQVLPIIAIALMYIYGNKTPTVTDVSFAPLYGISAIANSIGATPSVDLISTQMGLPVFSPALNITIIVLALLLIITWGWQNVGAAYVVRGLYRGEPVFVWSDFFYAIKRNLKQGFFMGLVDALIMIVLAVDFIFFFTRGGTFTLDFMYFVIFALVLIYMVMRFYIYLMLITFDLKISKIIKNALIFTVLGIKRNLLAIIGSAILLAINGLLIIWTLPSGFSLPVVLPFIYLFASLLFITTYAAYPVIDKHMIAPYVNKTENNIEEE